MVKLTTEEEKILFNIYKKKYLGNSNPFRISNLESEFITEYDRRNIINAIKSFVSQEFIVGKLRGITISSDNVMRIIETPRQDVVDYINLEFSIPNIEKYKEIKKLLWFPISINWLKEKAVRILQFIWKHIIIFIIVSVITTYIITIYFTPQ